MLRIENRLVSVTCTFELPDYVSASTQGFVTVLSPPDLDLSLWTLGCLTRMLDSRFRQLALVLSPGVHLASDTPCGECPDSRSSSRLQILAASGTTQTVTRTVNFCQMFQPMTTWPLALG